MTTQPTVAQAKEAYNIAFEKLENTRNAANVRAEKRAYSNRPYIVTPSNKPDAVSRAYTIFEAAKDALHVAQATERKAQAETVNTTPNMKTIVKEVTVFTATELSYSARERAYSNWLENALDYNWYEFVLDDAKEIGRLLGINDMKIHFSGFASQGDGACFTGRYYYAKNAPATVKSYAPLDTELHRIAKELQDAQRPSFYQLTASITHQARYYHENSVSIQVEDNGNYYAAISDEKEESIAEPLRDFMRWIYKALENEYEHLTSEEAFLESAECNEYQYTEKGKLF